MRWQEKLCEKFYLNRYRTKARCVGETITLGAKIINSFVAGIFLITYPKESKNTLSTWRIMKNYDKS